MPADPDTNNLVRIPEVPTPTRLRILMVSLTVGVVILNSVLEFVWYTPWWAWAIPVALTLVTVLTWPVPDVLLDLRRRQVKRLPVVDLNFQSITQVELLPTVVSDSLPNQRLSKGQAWAVVLRGQLRGRDRGVGPYCDAEIQTAVTDVGDQGLRDQDAVLITAQHPLSSGFSIAKQLARSFDRPLKIDLGDLLTRLDSNQLDQEWKDRCATLRNGSAPPATPEGVRETRTTDSMTLRWTEPYARALIGWSALTGTLVAAGTFAIAAGHHPALRTLGFLALALCVIPLWRSVCLARYGGRKSLVAGPQSIHSICASRWIPSKSMPLKELELVHGQTPRTGAAPELGSPTSNAVVLLGHQRTHTLTASKEVADWVPARVHEFCASEGPAVS